MIYTKNLSRAQVLAALYNGARPQGMGFLHYNPAPMTVEEAQGMLDKNPARYFDYLKGRVMKVDLSGVDPAADNSGFDERLYDRDNGRGAAQLLITDLLESGEVASVVTELLHDYGKSEAAKQAKEMVQRDTSEEDVGGTHVIHMGLADQAETLGPAIDKALGGK